MVDFTPGFSLGISHLFGGGSKPSPTLGQQAYNTAQASINQEANSLPVHATNAPTKNSGNNTPSQSTANTGSTLSAADAQTLAQNQAAIDIANNAIGKIPNELNIALGNVQGQYNVQKKSLANDDANALTQYNQGQTTNQQDYRTGENQVNQQAGEDQQSLLRLLAGMGAGGGSEAQYLVPQLVGDVAAKGLGQAANVYAKNAQGLSTNYGNFQNDEKDSENTLQNWLDQQQQSARSTADTNKQSLLTTIAGLQTNSASAQPYIDKINTLQGQIDDLQKFSPAYTGTMPTYTAAPLSTFTPAGNQQAQVTAQNNAQGSATPYLALLAGLQKKQQQVV